ncbi:MAG: hypothetical protein HND52_10055 [Ignavibacteriae bacterium]|nr:hypothetical protein [Ignavibacteriota bacterium]NOG98291.1 hypothetical protein [Ignavibacteriota bacterium]
MVNEDSILRKLIDELNAVMIEDRKFQEIINKVEENIQGLRENTDILKDSSRNVSEASGSLVEYINKEEAFSTGVEKLINRLKEIEDIKDLNGKFWDDIERNMKHGVDILSEGNEQLLKDIEKLDDQFNNRMNQSFINLDKVLQAMVTEHHRRMSDITDRLNGDNE